MGTNRLEMVIRIHFQMSGNLLRFEFIAHILETIIWSADHEYTKEKYGNNNSRIISNS